MVGKTSVDGHGARFEERCQQKLSIGKDKIEKRKLISSHRGDEDA